MVRRTRLLKRIIGLDSIRLSIASAVLLANVASAAAQNPAAGQGQNAASQSTSQALVESGKSLFTQKCAFCHGRDAGGGETGPDLTSSQLVAQDVGGDKIGVVVRNGRVDKGMPRFNISEQDIAALAAFIHYEKDKASRSGNRRRVSASDLQTGDAGKGKAYFYGAGTCSSCHSPTGDLAGVARRYPPLKLLERMLYPADSPAKITVTLRSGKTVSWNFGVPGRVYGCYARCFRLVSLLGCRRSEVQN